jgi:hypothetical protein
VVHRIWQSIPSELKLRVYEERTLSRILPWLVLEVAFRNEVIRLVVQAAIKKPLGEATVVCHEIRGRRMTNSEI